MLVADMSKPIYRHLAEQKWREEGDLDLLVRRVSPVQRVGALTG